MVFILVADSSFSCISYFKGSTELIYETLSYHITTRRNNPEDSDLNLRDYEKPKPRKIKQLTN